MANWELQLISRIARCNELQTVLQWGITEEDFLTGEGRGIFRAISGFYSQPDTRGTVLGEEAMRAYFPTIRLFDDPGVTTQHLCSEVRRTRLSMDLENGVQQVVGLAGDDPLAAANKLSLIAKSILNVGMSNARADVHFGTSFSRSVDRAKLIAGGADFSKARWAWRPLDRATMGIQEDDFAVLYGRPKSMKSFVLGAQFAACIDQGKRLLLYTKEMTPDNIFQRIGCTLAAVDYDAFRHGTLTRRDWQAVEGTVTYLQKMQHEQLFVCLNGQDAPKGGDTVDWLDAKVDKYEPDVVFIDGMYLMSDSKGAKKTNEKVRNISNELRAMNLRRKTPVIATLQANRDAAKNNDANLDEIAFSDAISQDATLLMRIINEHKSGKPTLAIIIGGARECKLPGFRIWGIPCVNFGDVTAEGFELSSKDVQQAQTDDTDDDKKGGAKKKAGPSVAAQENAALISVKNRVDKLVT